MLVKIHLNPLFLHRKEDTACTGVLWRCSGGSEACEGPALPQTAGRRWVGLVSLYIASTPCEMGALPSLPRPRWGFSSWSSSAAGLVGFQPPQRRPCRRPGRSGDGGSARGRRQVAPARLLRRPTAKANGRGTRRPGARGRCHRGNCPGFLGRGQPPPYFPVYCTSNS